MRRKGVHVTTEKRDRKQTSMYAPPPKPSKKKIKLPDLSSDTVDTWTKDKKGKMTAKKRIKEEADTSDFVMQMFGTERVPQGLSTRTWMDLKSAYSREGELSSLDITKYEDNICLSKVCF